MSNRRDFALAFLHGLQKPTTDHNVIAVLTWIRSEFGRSAPIPAHFNPLATTEDLEPNTKYNDVGVRNFVTFDQGVRATVETLENGARGYAAILGAFEKGDDPRDVINAVRASAWGSHPSDSMLAYVLNNEAAEAELEVGAGDVAPEHAPDHRVPKYPGTLLKNFTEGHGAMAWQYRMHRRGWTIGVDDKYGPQSERVCRAFQAEKGLDVDGIVGPITWAAAWTAPVTR